MSEYVTEMDTIDVLQLDPTNYKYADGVTKVFRDCEDPFKRDIAELKFERNPSEPTKLIKELDMFPKRNSNH